MSDEKCKKKIHKKNVCSLKYRSVPVNYIIALHITKNQYQLKD